MGLLWFWVAAAVMVGVVGVVLGQALRHGRQETLAAPGAEDVGIYRDQLAEVSRDLARGTLAPAEAQRLTTEISRRLLAADARTTADTAPRASQGALAFGLVALTMAGAVGLYQWLGAPAYPDLPLETRMELAQKAYDNRPTQAQSEATAPKMDAPADADPKMLELIDQLRQVVKTHPDDVQGLTYLAKYEGVLGNFSAAAAAQAHLVVVLGEKATAEDFASQAELMIMAAGGAVSPEAEQALIAALKRQPTNAPARYYSGLMFAQVGRPDRTFQLWEPLLQEGPPDAPWILPIRDQIEDIAARAGVRYELPALKGPSTEDVAAAADMTPEDRQQMIETMVAGLETRLMADGGPVEDWAKLINALGVLGQVERAQSAYDAAKTAFAADPGALSALGAAATQAGLAP
jgi:cytochrome c-type biogenesis protein CcmH